MSDKVFVIAGDLEFGGNPKSYYRYGIPGVASVAACVPVDDAGEERSAHV